MKSRSANSSLFLMELIIAILFFTVAASLCVQFFVKADTMRQEGEELRRAVNACTACAELISSENSVDGIQHALKNSYPQGKFAEDSAVLTENLTLEFCVQDALWKGTLSYGEVYSLEVVKALEVGANG